ncbi:MAG: glycosyltransferase [Lachnospiraceae bacterium]|nr:glycosyltransferase [Lachnospiraceae bacterium]
MNIQVIIPVYKPDNKLIKIIDKLRKQTVKPSGINLVWSRQDHEEDAVMSRIKRECGDIRILEIPVEEFDHGGTRRRAVRNTPCDIFVMMTQDAVPKNDMLIETLTAPLRMQMKDEDETFEDLLQGSSSDGDEKEGDGPDEKIAGKDPGKPDNGTVIACVYGRQLPGRDSSPYEKLSRLHNYSELSRTKTRDDIKKLGIKAFFCSDVCCAYRRDIYEECGGFVRNTVFNEDMIMARRFLDKGYAVRYEATAAVIHSHDYSAMEQLRRNFDLGASQAMFPDVFGGISSESEGVKFAVSSIKLLIKKGRPMLIPGFCMQCFFKLVGYRLGKKYASLPNAVIMKLASNKNYWKQMKERH